jgi:hypothetical protein
MVERHALRLWIDDQSAAPAGWRGVATLDEAQRLLRSGRVAEVSLGGSSALIDGSAQALEQGAFTGRLRRVAVAIHATDPAIATLVAPVLANAGRHWDAQPPEPDKPAKPPKPTARQTIQRFIMWHLLGFVLAIGVAEVWSLVKHKTHAPVVAWVLRLGR